MVLSRLRLATNPRYSAPSFLFATTARQEGIERGPRQHQPLLLQHGVAVELGGRQNLDTVDVPRRLVDVRVELRGADQYGGVEERQVLLAGLGCSLADLDRFKDARDLLGLGPAQGQLIDDHGLLV